MGDNSQNKHIFAKMSMIEQQETSYPKIEGGGSLLLAWRIKNKHVLVVGGGEVRAGTLMATVRLTRRTAS